MDFSPAPRQLRHDLTLILPRFFILSGCSGGGKSTLLDELARRGHVTVPEPGRRIVHTALETDGQALPWVDLAAFAQRAMELARADIALALVNTKGPVFFDRGLVDAAVALQHATGEAILPLAPELAAFNRTVFLTPPWPEIYAADTVRQHSLAEAEQEYLRLKSAYQELGFESILLPKIDVQARADLIEQLLSQDVNS
ncbi:AAA family ATPase [Sandaracinobacteroides hominis]|uniref:AAA family ATPase n=1 Tax=Sandaracinobacteroides hominis TaxID=2780086 RepID=UPI002E2C9344|nr:AAA family ATPase [Sandaracinobacteroides hominis]